MAAKLTPGMRVEDFRNGYFYAADIKAFARQIGIRVGNLRKIELENAIATFLETGIVPETAPPLPRKPGAARDDLDATQRVINYVGDRRTKDFLVALAETRHGPLKAKSGQWYWLNDWRRARQTENAHFTYADMADHLAGLAKTEGRLPPIPSARMNNFLTEFRADPANAKKSRADAMAAWERLKSHEGPKTYEAYLRAFGGG